MWRPKNTLWQAENGPQMKSWKCSKECGRQMICWMSDEGLPARSLWPENSLSVIKMPFSPSPCGGDWRADLYGFNYGWSQSHWNTVKQTNLHTHTQVWAAWIFWSDFNRIYLKHEMRTRWGQRDLQTVAGKRTRRLSTSAPRYSFQTAVTVMDICSKPCSDHKSCRQT